MKVLVTGFEPFGAEPFNPSGACLAAVRQELSGTFDVKTEQLPVDLESVRRRLPELLSEYAPDIYVALGLAPGRHAMAVERVAINVLDFPIPDNVGSSPADEPVVPDGPLAYAATLPIKAIVRECTAAGLPIYVSNTAGTYLCNATMYLGLDWAVRQGAMTRVGFIHLPHAAEHVPRPDQTGALPLAFMARGVAQAIHVSARVSQDIAGHGGAVH